MPPRGVFVCSADGTTERDDRLQSNATGGLGLTFCPPQPNPPTMRDRRAFSMSSPKVTMKHLFLIFFATSSFVTRTVASDDEFMFECKRVRPSEMIRALRLRHCLRSFIQRGRSASHREAGRSRPSQEKERAEGACRCSAASFLCALHQAPIRGRKPRRSGDFGGVSGSSREPGASPSSGPQYQDQPGVPGGDLA